MSSVDDETIMDVLTESDAPRLTTTEIAEELPLARGTVRSRLQTLADEGRLDREREGRDVVWFLPDRADEPAPDPVPDDDGDGDENRNEDEPEAGDGEADATDADDDGEGEGEVEANEAGEADEGTDPPAVTDAGGESAGETVDETSDGAESTAITERGKTVAADAGTGAGGPGRPIDRGNEDLLVRAAIAAVLLAVVYAVFRRIRGES